MSVCAVVILVCRTMDGYVWLCSLCNETEYVVVLTRMSVGYDTTTISLLQAGVFDLPRRILQPPRPKGLHKSPFFLGGRVARLRKLIKK